MRWTSPLPAVRFSCLLLLTLLLSAQARAQTVPAGQGLVADSTELRV